MLHSSAPSSSFDCRSRQFIRFIFTINAIKWNLKNCKFRRIVNECKLAVKYSFKVLEGQLHSFKKFYTSIIHYLHSILFYSIQYYVAFAAANLLNWIAQMSAPKLSKCRRYPTYRGWAIQSPGDQESINLYKAETFCIECLFQHQPNCYEFVKFMWMRYNSW